MRTEITVTIVVFVCSSLGGSSPFRRTMHLPPNSTQTSLSNSKGTVTKMEWTNPHVWIHVDVKKPDGTLENGPSKRAHPNVAVSSRLY